MQISERQIKNSQANNLFQGLRLVLCNSSSVMQPVMASNNHVIQEDKEPKKQDENGVLAPLFIKKQALNEEMKIQMTEEVESVRGTIRAMIDMWEATSKALRKRKKTIVSNLTALSNVNENEANSFTVSPTKTPREPNDDSNSDILSKTPRGPNDDSNSDILSKTPGGPKDDSNPDSLSKTPRGPKDDSNPDSLSKTPRGPKDDSNPDTLSKTPREPKDYSNPDTLSKTPREPNDDSNPDTLSKTPQEPKDSKNLSVLILNKGMAEEYCDVVCGHLKKNVEIQRQMARDCVKKWFEYLHRFDDTDQLPESSSYDTPSSFSYMASILTVVGLCAVYAILSFGSEYTETYKDEFLDSFHEKIMVVLVGIYNFYLGFHNITIDYTEAAVIASDSRQ